MGRLTSTIVLVVILAGLGAYIYFVDRQRPAAGTEEAKAKAFDVSPENIEEVAIKNAAGETTRVQRVEADWHVVEPEKADADATAVASSRSNPPIATATLDRTRLSEWPSSWVRKMKVLGLLIPAIPSTVLATTRESSWRR